jgi:hypothetical protein
LRTALLAALLAALRSILRECAPPYSSVFSVCGLKLLVYADLSY